MPLQHSSGEPEPTLDAETAARALGLAARLQEERDERVGLSDLRLAAAEAGIAPDLLDEALRRVATPPVPAPRPARQPLPDALTAVPLFVFSLLYLFVHIAGANEAYVRPSDLSWSIALLAPLIVALLAPRRGRQRAWAPLLVAGSWLLLAIIPLINGAYAQHSAFHRHFLDYFAMGLVQFLAYALGTGLRTGYDRLRAHAPAPTNLQRD